ncbi:MAG: serine/threonine-protein kinase, partial [Acidobacteriota bacterium]
MTPERWERIKGLFEAALKRGPKERFGFVSAACRDDPSLRDEVLRLISLDEESASSLHEPYFDVRKAFLHLQSERRTIALGEVLAGRFRLVRLIGEGGMGEVYKAFDPELQEHVALKTIRAEIASDPKSIARLQREFQMARRVTHANVCRIYDLDRHSWPDGRLCVFLTMELIEGETLAQRLRRGGKMPVGDALPIVVQMAQALAAAHRQGVVHRDFKPSNIMLDDSSGPSL